MRYFSYNELIVDGKDEVITVSEEDIRQSYYPYWREKMSQRFGKEYVDENFSFEDCLDHWIVVNWAWKSE